MPKDLTGWLAAYGKAWEARDPEAACELFARNAEYYETPYSEPYVGPEGVREYWDKVTADQRDVEFESRVVGTADDTSVATWRATFTLASSGAFVELDGVFLLRFDDKGRCTELREWWHIRP